MLTQALLKAGLKQLTMEKCASLQQIWHDVAAHTLRNGCKPKLYVCMATIRDRQISSVDHSCPFPVDQFVHRLSHVWLALHSICITKPLRSAITARSSLH